MIRYIGLDVHKRVVQACILDARGTVLHQLRFPCTREDLEAFARKHLTKKDLLALEATSNTWPVVRVLRPFVKEVVVSNPLKTKAIAQAKIKTDKVDALVLAQLLRCDYLPRVWIPDEETGAMRRLTSYRAALVSDRTTFKNRIHAVLALQMLHPPVEDLFGKKGMAWLQEAPLGERERMILQSDLKMLQAVEQRLAELDGILAQTAYATKSVRLLMTLPGLDYTVAQGLVAALGDISRFPDGDHAAAYLGLTPSTKQSAEHCYHGPITKHGNPHARWLLVQAAQHLASHPGPLGAFFRKLLKRKNRNVAVVATARKLVVTAFHMLKNNEPYRYAVPRTTEAKLSRLRVKATQQRRKTGSPKGTPRPKNYGTGQGTRAIPSLAKVYASEELPQATPFKQLPPGELRMLAEKKITPFVRGLQTSTRIPKRRTPKKPMQSGEAQP